ncbi:MAG TPA: sigma-70 family RNA polymerase sigma factor [Kofleriaceae bacterium]|nr:sigma-70 family RNA polymerase sigma factor [Kofleriaceae bacterium]
MEPAEGRLDEAAICARFANRIRSYGLLHLRDRSAADDLVQHVLIAVVVALREARIEQTEHLEHYVFGTARNTVMAMRRGTTRQERIADEVAKTIPQDYVPSWRPLDRKRLEHCLLLLDSRDRAVVLATYLEEKEPDEIASAMQLSLGNVRVIRHRALTKLQGCVEHGATA